jgi:hypothetical protein
LHPLPVFALNLFIVKVYVVNSASLVAAVQRNHKTISFGPFTIAVASRGAGITGDGLKLHEDPENGGAGLGIKVLHAMHPALLGSGLDMMNIDMIKHLKASIDELEPEQTAIDLHLWCRHAIAVASTEAVYGPLNPYKDPAIERAFW